jgi:hypothetical protein
MSEPSTPRQMVKALVHGAMPPRPLLAPIIFSLGARLQNVSLRQFLTNPTKIVNALRQIRSVLKVDGLTCYFDPFLEAEALGCKREWRADGSCAMARPSFGSVDQLRSELTAVESLPGAGNIPVACEVLRRLKAILQDEPALMVRVSGPLSLAARLAASAPPELVEFASEVVATVTKSFAEAGADIVLLVEDSLPDSSSESLDWYGSLVTPIANAVRFYEALPVVSWGATSAAELSSLVERSWDWALCPLLTSEMLAGGAPSHAKQACTALALPSGDFCGGAILPDSLSNPNLSLVTSAEDIHPTVDVKQLVQALDAIRERRRLQRSIQSSI